MLLLTGYKQQLLTLGGYKFLKQPTVPNYKNQNNGSQPGMLLLPKRHLTMSGSIFNDHNCAKVVRGGKWRGEADAPILQVGAYDADKHPTMYKA